MFKFYFIIINTIMNRSLKPHLVDKNLFAKSKPIIYKPTPLSFYFNIIIILFLLLGVSFLYYKYITKKDNNLILQNKLLSLHERINTQLKNID